MIYNKAFANSERSLAESCVDVNTENFPSLIPWSNFIFFVLYYKRNIKHFHMICR